MTLQVGDKAPEFTLETDTHEFLSLQQLLGKKVVLYFYPKDLTPGCTQQACDLRDHFAQFHQQQAVILGISKDKPAMHQKFKQKYHLPFTLLSDIDAKVCEAYGVINPKSFFGKTFLGIQRSTFLIDEKGYIQAIWRKVKVSQHSEMLLQSLTQGSS